MDVSIGMEEGEEEKEIAAEKIRKEGRVQKRRIRARMNGGRTNMKEGKWAEIKVR